MELRLIRQVFTATSTIGELFIDERMDRECYILEDTVRPNAAGAGKVKGKTAIPPGRYEVIISFSNRFQRMLPLLLDVQNFDGIRIHPGNTAADTEGCLLPGLTAAENLVGESRKAFAGLFAKLRAAAQGEKIFLTIVERPIGEKL